MRQSRRRGRQGRRVRVGLGLLVVAVALTPGCGRPTAPEDASSAAGPTIVRVAAASDLKPALDDLAGLLRRTDPPIEVSAVYGSSGTFAQQIANGAPYDVFLSADLAYPQRLVDGRLAAPGGAFPFAVGRLVLWTRTGSSVDLARGVAGLADPKVRLVAVASSAHAPYGRAAEAALDAAGVLDAVRPKLVGGESVGQAAELARSGATDAGLVALSLALTPAMRAVGRYVEVPAGTYPPLRQAGVVLTRSTVPVAAAAVRDLLLSPEGQAVLRAHGFASPGG